MVISAGRCSAGDVPAHDQAALRRCTGQPRNYSYYIIAGEIMAHTDGMSTHHPDYIEMA